MTNWTNDPPTGSEFHSYKLLRCPPKGQFKGTVLSKFPVGCDLHYWKGRSTPCAHADCPACKAGNRPRWKGYLFVRSTATGTIGILEYTARAHDAIALFLVRYPNLRGARITLTRTGNRPNSPLMITFEEDRSDEALLPAPDDLTECLERMWEVRQREIPDVEDRYVNDPAAREVLPNRFATMTNGHKP